MKYVISLSFARQRVRFYGEFDEPRARPITYASGRSATVALDPKRKSRSTESGWQGSHAALNKLRYDALALTHVNAMSATATHYHTAMAPKSIPPDQQESWVATPDADTPGSYPFNVVNYMLVLAALSQVRSALNVLNDCEAKDRTSSAFRLLNRALEDLDALKTRLDHR